MYRAKEDLHLTADRSRVVKSDDPIALFLLAPAGSEVSDEDVKKYGLSNSPLVSNADGSQPAVTTGPSPVSTIETIDRGTLDLTTGKPVDPNRGPANDQAIQDAVEKALDGQAQQFNASYRQRLGELQKAEAERDAAVQEQAAARQLADKATAERDDLKQQGQASIDATAKEIEAVTQERDSLKQQVADLQERLASAPKDSGTAGGTSVDKGTAPASSTPPAGSDAGKSKSK